MASRVGTNPHYSLRRPYEDSDEGPDKKRPNQATSPSNVQSPTFSLAPPAGTTYTFIHTTPADFSMGACKVAKKFKNRTLLPLSPAAQPMQTSPAPAVASSSFPSPQLEHLPDGSIVQQLPNGSIMRRYLNGKMELTGMHQAKAAPIKCGMEKEIEEMRLEVEKKRAEYNKYMAEHKYQFSSPELSMPRQPVTFIPPRVASLPINEEEGSDSQDSDGDVPNLDDLNISGAPILAFTPINLGSLGHTDQS